MHKKHPIEENIHQNPDIIRDINADLESRSEASPPPKDQRPPHTDLEDYFEKSFSFRQSVEEIPDQSDLKDCYDTPMSRYHDLDEKSSNPKSHRSKRKLTRDELLAGKATADESHAVPTDPRLKSPEELLRKYGKKQPKPELALQQDIEKIKAKHDKELNRWKEYEQQVNFWKEQVLEIVHNLKKELSERQEEKAHLNYYKTQLQLKEDQIQSLQKQLRQISAVRMEKSRLTNGA